MAGALLFRLLKGYAWLGFYLRRGVAEAAEEDGAGATGLTATWVVLHSGWA